MFSRGTIESNPRPTVDFERLMSEDLIPVQQKAKALGLHVGAVHRMANEGVLTKPARDGSRRRVYLELIKIGGRHYTSEQAWKRFILASNNVAEPGDSEGAPSVPVRRTTAQRRAAVEAANRKAEALGA